MEILQRHFLLFTVGWQSLVECTGLENRRARMGPGGSNPSPTAKKKTPRSVCCGVLLCFERGASCLLQASGLSELSTGGPAGPLSPNTVGVVPGEFVSMPFGTGVPMKRRARRSIFDFSHDERSWGSSSRKRHPVSRGLPEVPSLRVLRALRRHWPTQKFLRTRLPSARWYRYSKTVSPLVVPLGYRCDNKPCLEADALFRRS